MIRPCFCSFARIFGLISSQRLYKNWTIHSASVLVDVFISPICFRYYVNIYVCIPSFLNVPFECFWTFSLFTSNTSRSLCLLSATQCLALHSYGSITLPTSHTFTTLPQNAYQPLTTPTMISSLSAQSDYMRVHQNRHTQKSHMATKPGK